MASADHGKLLDEGFFLASREAPSCISSRPRRSPSRRQAHRIFGNISLRRRPMPKLWPPSLAQLGFRLVSGGGTDNHLLLLGLTPPGNYRKVGGRDAGAGGDNGQS